MSVRTLHLLLLCSLGLLLPAEMQYTTSLAHELHVKPTEDTSCPEPCHTLDEYVKNASQYFVSNTTFNFLPGNHSLSQSLNVSGVTNLALVAINVTVTITCVNTSPVVFADISGLVLESLVFSACGTLALSNLLDLNMYWIDIQPPQYKQVWTLNALNILGNSSLEGLNILGYAGLTVRVHIQYRTDPNYTAPSHNLLDMKHFTVQSSSILYVKCDLSQLNYIVNLIVANMSTSYTLLGLDVQSNTTNTITLAEIHVDNFILRALVESLGGTQVTIADSVLNNTFQEYQRFFAIIGAATSSKSITVRNVTFSGFFVLYLNNVMNSRFVACKFHDVIGYPELGSRASTVLLINSQGIDFVNCTFHRNIGTPVVAVDSTFVLSGTNVFSNNTAYEGGALALYGHSHVTLAKESETVFSHNLAETVGGVIFVDYIVYGTCFFHLESEYNCSTSFTPAFSLDFENNTAKHGGNKVYGAEFDQCSITNNPTEFCFGWNFVSSIFHVDLRNNSDLSAITSKVRRACLCENGRPNCTTVFSNRTAYPGETFQIPAVVVGDRFGTVDGSVYAHVLPSSGTGNLDDLEYSQHVEHQKCTNLSYTIFSNSSSVILALTAASALLEEYQYPNQDIERVIREEMSTYEDTGEIGEYLESVPSYINITLLPCPLGFVLSGEPPRCNCDPRLQDKGIDCNLMMQTAQRSGTEWVNASFDNGIYNGVIVNEYCPNNYCREQLVNVSLDQPDTQCAFKHSGFLCGGCQLGLSVALGSAQCLSCSNAYLALLIPFALAGFALVFFIKLLNLTVAEGTLNGLIFYANTVRANQVVWIPEDNTDFLKVFIAWLNLDLGIETCFFDGLDAYWKTWLQFVFPMYIWAISIVIIVLSHYFSKLAKVFGSNAVQVLATLLFLSYSKLLRTVISILQASTIDYPDGHTATVWSYDGNIAYLGRKHVPLFLVALAIIIFIWLPYTGILTSAQLLQRVSNYRVTKMLVKLKPVLDAYYGPLKDKHRYWFGLLLLVRGVLFISFSAASARNSNVGLLLTVTASLALLMHLAYTGRVYRKRYLSLLENSFILNLGVLAGGTLYINTSGGSQMALAYVSVGTAFVQFVVVLTTHAIAPLKAFFTRYCRPILQAPDQAECEGLANSPVANAQSCQELVVSLDDFREPFLKYSDSDT